MLKTSTKVVLQEIGVEESKLVFTAVDVVKKKLSFLSMDPKEPSSATGGRDMERDHRIDSCLLF